MIESRDCSCSGCDEFTFCDGAEPPGGTARKTSALELPLVDDAESTETSGASTSDARKRARSCTSGEAASSALMAMSERRSIFALSPYFRPISRLRESGFVVTNPELIWIRIQPVGLQPPREPWAKRPSRRQNERLAAMPVTRSVRRCPGFRRLSGFLRRGGNGGGLLLLFFHFLLRQHWLETAPAPRLVHAARADHDQLLGSS